LPGVCAGADRRRGVGNLALLRIECPLSVIGSLNADLE
jgi:hypothetical protein